MRQLSRATCSIWRPRSSQPSPDLGACPYVSLLALARKFNKIRCFRSVAGSSETNRRLARPEEVFLASVYSRSRAFSVLYARSAIEQCLQGTGRERPAMPVFLTSVSSRSLVDSTRYALQLFPRLRGRTRSKPNQAERRWKCPQWPTEGQH